MGFLKNTALLLRSIKKYTHKRRLLQNENITSHGIKGAKSPGMFIEIITVRIDSRTAGERLHTHHTEATLRFGKFLRSCSIKLLQEVLRISSFIV